MALDFRIRENHQMKGKVPTIPTYEHVDTEMLYEGDESPFHLNLSVFEYNRISLNGLHYDAPLIQSLSEQMIGRGGIRGHKGFFNSDDYPINEVYWIGHVEENGRVWAKGYIPPGRTREDIRRIKAIGGEVGTSLYGQIMDEENDVEYDKDGTYRLRNFQLITLDLVHPDEAALEVGKENGFAITRETKQDKADTPTEDNPTEQVHEDIDMDEITNVSQVPDSIIATIEESALKRAKVEEKAARVGELETTVSELKAQLSEADQEKTKLSERVEVLEKEAESVRIRERDLHLSTAINALTESWQVTTEEGKSKRESLHRMVKTAVLAELAQDATGDAIKEAVNNQWENTYKVVGEAFVAQLSGGNAHVPGKDNSKPAYANVTDDQIAESRQRTGI